MRIKQVVKISFLAGIAAIVLAGCGHSQSSGGQKQTASWMLDGELNTTDPSLVQDMDTTSIVNSTNEPLLKMAAHSKVEPGVAKSYHVSKDGKTWTFSLRHDAKWANGTPVTAQDFVYSWQRTVTPKTGSQYAYIFSGIKNATAIVSGKKSPKTLGVQAKGKYQLVVHLVKVQPYFKYIVTICVLSPENEAFVKKAGSKFGTKAQYTLSNGPFILKGWNGSNDQFYLAKNKHYWNQKAIKLEKLKIDVVKDSQTAANDFQSGQLDGIHLGGLVKQYKNNKDFHLYKQASTSYLELNQRRNKYFQNRNIRRAISLAINREQLTKKVLDNGSSPANGYVSKATAFHNGKDFADQAEVKSAVAYNLTEAKKLWAKGLKELGGKSLKVDLLSTDQESSKREAEFIQSQLERLPRLHVQITSIPLKAEQDRLVNGQFDLAFSAWVADYPDPTSFLDLFVKGGSFNDGKWNSSEYDSLMKKAESTDALNENARWQDLVKAEKVLMNDQGIVPLSQSGDPMLIKSSIKGFQYFPTTPQWDWSKVSVE